MAFFYFSFCDVTKPPNQQFLGATLIEADDIASAHKESKARGINPGGEVAVWELVVDHFDELPPKAQALLNRFAPASEVRAEGGRSMGEMLDSGDEVALPTNAICQDHN